MIAISPSALREVVRQHPRQPKTNLLTPWKPYLYLNVQTGEYHVLYWVAWFQTRDGRYRKGAKWIGSDWYDELPKDRFAKHSTKWNDWPQMGRIWELPGVKYSKPKNYTAFPEHSGTKG